MGQKEIAKDHPFYYPGKSLMAMFLDADNFSHNENTQGALALLLNALKPWGQVLLRRAYGIVLRQKPHFSRELQENKFSLHHTAPLKKGSTDMRIAVDIAQTLYTRPEIQTVVLATGDGDFADIVNLIHQQKRRAIGIGYRKSSSKKLIAACDVFLFYDDILSIARAPKQNQNILQCSSELRATHESLRALLRRNQLCPPDPEGRKNILDRLSHIASAIESQETLGTLLDKLTAALSPKGVSKSHIRNTLNALMRANMLTRNLELPFSQKPVSTIPSACEMENAICNLQLQTLLQNPNVVADPITFSQVIWGDSDHIQEIESILENKIAIAT